VTDHKFTIYNLNTHPLIEQQLINGLKKGLPASVTLQAYNFSRAGNSLYALLRREQTAGPLEWLTLRLADHPLWLKGAQQLFINFGNPADLKGIAQKVTHLFRQPEVDNYFYKLSSLEIAVLQFLDACQKEGMIWAVRLPTEVFAARKQLSFELKQDFLETDLFLGDRNNLNTLLLPVEAKEYQAELGILFGRNLLFSQFARGDLLRLLPTNQWIQPLIEYGKDQEQDWQEQIASEYGEQLLEAYEKGKKSS